MAADEKPERPGKPELKPETEVVNPKAAKKAEKKAAKLAEREARNAAYEEAYRKPDKGADLGEKVKKDSAIGNFFVSRELRYSENGTFLTMNLSESSEWAIDWTTS
jgi:hypothetical protein